MSALQRLEIAIFTACFFAFAYFNQGGGWNQNSRFAEVRAMVEQGRFAIDDFLVYRRNAQGDDLVRVPVQNAEYTLEGKRFRLAWVDMVWNLFPVGDHPLQEGVEKAPMVELCSSGDISYVPHTGHFHPNKPPGASFLGLPGYFVIYHVEKWLGINPDHWWTMNVNAWLVTVCSVGLLSALGCVIFFRLARDFSGGAILPAVLATVTFAFGTTFFPFGTLFFDHNLTAVLALAGFYFLWNVRKHGAEGDTKRADRLQFMAGLCAGFSVITNYVAVFIVLFLGLYSLLATGKGRFNWRGAIAYCLGGVGPFILFCWYGWVCFGSPFKINNDFQNPLFKDPNGALGMFALPNGYVAALLLFSPFRGILYFAPVLAMGFYGIVVWLREKQYAPEARLCLAIFGLFFLVNASFNGYHAGFSAGPRYLVPGLPFLALPLVVAFARWRWVTAGLAGISIASHLLLTATDAQNPVGVGGHVRVEGRRDEWDYNLLADYAWPLFAHGRAWPLLEEQIEMEIEKESAQLEDDSDESTARKLNPDALRAELRASIIRGDSSPFLLGSVEGPVSVNPVGVHEGLFTYSFFPPGSPQVRWASFNVGELLTPESFWAQSRWSLLPLLLLSGGLSAWAIMLAGRVDRSRPSDRSREASSKPAGVVLPG